MKKKKAILFTILGIVLVCCFISVLFFYTYSVSGKITDLANKEPVPDIEVSINGLIDKTNTNGFFEIKHIKLYQKGPLQIEATKDYEEISSISLDYSNRNIIHNIEIKPTLKVMVNRMNIASRNVQYDYLWDYMHSDDQQYWESRDNYIEAFKKLFGMNTELGYSAPERKIEENIRKLEQWKHEITNKEYTNVMEVPVEVKIIYDGKEQTQIVLQHWQKINGVWRYFTQADKEASEEVIKAYEELKDLFSD